ncbi:MAG TPA: DUF167 domain-containing protein [Pyrinomonadaceae bacterium]|nr:DUF167 domain-containing protein [Pyrinomonadaceae bacterium]
MKLEQKDGWVTFDVRVIPRASKTEIVGEHDGALKIKLTSPPVEGAANDELIRILAKGFGVSKSQVEIISGSSSRSKRVRVRGVDPQKSMLF